MNTLTRRACLALLALPAACSLQPLAPLRRSLLDSRNPMPALRAPALGQRWTYRVFNAYNGEQLDTVQEEITSLAPITLSRQSARRGDLPPAIQAAWGLLKQDPVWDNVQTSDTPLPIWPSPLQVGATQAIDTAYRAGTSSFRLWLSVQSRVSAFERVTLPSGEFDTVRIDKFIRLSHSDSSRQNFTRTDTLWLAPAIGRWVARETNGEDWTSGRRPNQYREDHLRWELDSW